MKKACKQIGASAYELFKRAYRWANDNVLDLEKVREHYEHYKKRGVVTDYVVNFIRGQHHTARPNPVAVPA